MVLNESLSITNITVPYVTGNTRTTLVNSILFLIGSAWSEGPNDIYLQNLVLSESYEIYLESWTWPRVVKKKID